MTTQVRPWDRSATITLLNPNKNTHQDLSSDTTVTIDETTSFVEGHDERDSLACLTLGIPFLGPSWVAVREAGLVGVQVFEKLMHDPPEEQYEALLPEAWVAAQRDPAALNVQSASA